MFWKVTINIYAREVLFKMQQKFNLSIGGNTASAKDEIQRLQAQDFFDIKLVPFDEIEANKLNDYPIIEIDELAEEIKVYGLLEPLGLIRNPLDSPVKYRLYSGERRYTAIGNILKEAPDFPAFKNGIPCMIRKAADPIDEEIKIILSNKTRPMSEELRRKKAQRLAELYTLKQETTSEKFNITKKIATDLNIGERQAQRYTAINKKLIPELQKAFDDSKINLENAASIANMDLAAQKAVLELIEKNKTIGKQEIDLVKKQNEILSAQKNSSAESHTVDTEKLRNEIELATLEKDLKKRIDEYILLCQSYKSTYKEHASSPELSNKINQLLNLLK